jgi:hypothetical protein
MPAESVDLDISKASHSSLLAYATSTPPIRKARIEQKPIVARIDAEVVKLVRGAAGWHRRGSVNRLTVLVAPRAPPINGVRNDGRVTSFLASGPWLSLLAGEDSCYGALRLALSGKAGPVDMLIESGQCCCAGEPPLASVEVIVPHRGSDDHLAMCMRGLNGQSHEPETVVCVDQAVSPDLYRYLHFQASGRIRTFVISPSPAGPYVIRQHFGLSSNSQFLAFQDSDDYALPSRLELLVQHATATGADIVGCHELRLDEIEEAVFAFRFPLDVNAALTEMASHPQFFPTTIVRTETFRRIGGLSTFRTFGSDTEFLLRAYFSAIIRNVDAFLYIRRKRPGSLTTAPATSLDSPVRTALDRKWKTDFALIKSGGLTVERSSLAICHSSANYELTDLATGRLVAPELRA